MKKLIINIVFIFASVLSVSAQEILEENLKIYVEGTRLDFNYIRNNISFVDFVNDPKVSDVHIIIKRQITGGGGIRYSLEYNSPGFSDIPTFKLSCFILPNDSDDIKRKKITQTIQSGLLPFINEATGLSGVNIVPVERSIDENETAKKSQIIDPWNKWVFRLGASLGFEGEDRKSNLKYSFSGRADKVTDAWKLRSDYEYERSESIIEKDDGEKITTIRKTQDSDIRYVRSLNDHWSAGIFLQFEQSTYRNIKRSYQAIPAIQYNIYDWKDADRKQFTFGYHVGPTNYSYYETTIFDKTKEWLWKQAVEIRLERVETWGELDFTLEGGNYFPGFENYFIESRFDISLRVSRGVSINFQLRAESIHNQMYLPLSDLSDEELLLNTRKLPTNFEYSGRIGIRFQFGSIFNNVVNERL